MLKNKVLRYLDSSVPSLQHLAAIRVAILICTQKDIQCIIGRFRKTVCFVPTGFIDSQWKMIYDKARLKFWLIFNPEIIIEDENIIMKAVLDKIWPISYEILKWIRYHYWDIGTVFLVDSCWTSHGTIDYKKTAENLVKYETMHIRKRFRLACLNCLENEINLLWQNMNEADRTALYYMENLTTFWRNPRISPEPLATFQQNSRIVPRIPNIYRQNPIILYWVLNMLEYPMEQSVGEIIIHRYAFRYAARKGYLNAAAFFLEKLRPNMDIKGIINFSLKPISEFHRTAKDNPLIPYFLFYEIGENDQEAFLIRMSCSVMQCLLEWPMQKFFMTTAKRMWHLLSKNMYGELLEKILAKHMKGFKDYNYLILFIEFWHESSDDYKSYINTKTRIGYNIFRRFVKEKFEFIFDENCFQQRAQLRANILKKENVPDINADDINFLKFLFKNQVTTKSSVIKFIKCHIGYYHYSSLNMLLKELLLLINDILENE